jgi:hypothetical protein
VAVEQTVIKPKIKLKRTLKRLYQQMGDQAFVDMLPLWLADTMARIG